MQAVEDHDPYLEPIGDTKFDTPPEPVEVGFEAGSVDGTDKTDPAAEADPEASEEDVVGGAVAAPMGQYETVGQHLEREREEGLELTIEDLGPDLTEIQNPYFRGKVRDLQSIIAKCEKDMRKLNMTRISAQEEIKILLGLDYRIVRLEQGSLFSLEHQADVARQEVQGAEPALAPEPQPLSEAELLEQNQTTLPMEDPPSTEEPPPPDTDATEHITEPGGPPGAVVAMADAKERRAAKQKQK